MRSVSTNFAASMADVSTTFARLWTFTRDDGTIIRLTDHVTDITDNNGLVYSSSNGFTATPVLTSALSIGSQSVQVTVPLTDKGFTDFDLRHRLWEAATATMAVINYLHPDYGTMSVFTGMVGRLVMSDKKRATIEVISKADPNIYVAGEKYSASCRNDLGDTNCRVPIFSLAVNITVTAAIDTLAFAVDTMAGQPDDYFALGQIKWLTGDNKTLVSDVLSNKLNLLTVSLFYPLPFPIAVGDTGQMLPGCDKQLTTCLLKFNNVVNFRGEPFAPSFGG